MMMKSAWTSILAFLWVLGFVAAISFVAYVVCFASMFDVGQNPTANVYKPFAGEPAPIVHIPKWFFLLSLLLFLGETKELRTLLDQVDVFLGFKKNSEENLSEVRRE